MSALVGVSLLAVALACTIYLWRELNHRERYLDEIGSRYGLRRWHRESLDAFEKRIKSAARYRVS